MSKTHAVTGAFGYTGKYITQRLLAKGENVITLTGNPNRPNPYGDKIQGSAFNFNNPDKLTETLRGIDTLFNTYWVRFDHSEITFEKAVANTQTLFQSAQAAGVRRIVHVSITNPSLDSHLPYFKR